MVLALLVIGVAAVTHGYLVHAPCDDTYIYLVYAQSALAGEGLTFNGERVQGFTSPLWMVVIVVLGVLGAPLPAAASLASGAAGLVLLVATFRLGRAFGLPAMPALIPPLMLAASPDVAFYLAAGLETTGFAAVCALLASVLGDAGRSSPELRAWSLAALSVCAVLLRPEGAFVVLAVLGYAGWRSRDLAGLVRCLGRVALGLGLVQVALRVYYGDWLPNTYFAKAGAGLENLDQGLAYLGAFVGAYPILVVLFLAAAVATARHPGPMSALAAGVVLWSLLVAVPGGDNMVGYRMLVPALPPMLVTAVGVFRSTRPRTLLAAALASALLTLGLWHGGHARQPAWGMSARELAVSWATQHGQRVAAGAELARRLPAAELIAVNAAGALPFHSRLPTIDMLGLNDRWIARHGDRDRSLPYGHQAGDGVYVLDRRPAAILFGGTGSREPTSFVSDRQIAADPRFVERYVPRQLSAGAWAHVRRDLLWSEP